MVPPMMAPTLVDLGVFPADVTEADVVDKWVDDVTVLVDDVTVFVDDVTMWVDSGALVS
jgi:hypothetical protein